MKKLSKIISVILTIFLMISIMTANKIYAATGSFSVSAGATNLNIGGTTSLTITATECEGQFLIKSSNNDVVAVSSSSEWVTGSTKVTLTAKSAGTATITVTANDVADTSEKTVTGSKTVSITVAAPTTPTTDPVTPTPTPTKSSEARLSNLGITPNDFSGFKADKYEYSVEVPNSVSSVKVYAKAKDSKATVTGTGTKKLNVGTNTASVVVKAEDGTTKTYTLTITRKEAGEDKTNTTTNTTTNSNTIAENTTIENEAPTTDYTDGIVLGLEKLEIKGYTLNPEFSTEINEYSLEVDKDVTSLEIDAKANFVGGTVEIAGNENFVDGENTITIIITNPETDKTATYQITVNRKAIIPGDLLSENNNNIIKMWVIRVAIVLAIGIIVAILVIMYKKQDNTAKPSAIPYSGIGYKTDREEENKSEVRVTKKENADSETLEDIKAEDTKKEDTKTENKEEKKITRTRSEEAFDEAIQKYEKRKGKHF